MGQITTTARDLIRRSMMLIQVLGSGENPSDQEAQDALLVLNEIVDKWNTESLMIPFFRNIELNLEKGKSIYEVDFPISGLDSAYRIDSNGFSQKIQILTKYQYEDILQKNNDDNYLTSVYYNATFPKGQLYVYPAGSTDKLILNVSGSFSVFPDLDSEISYPSGYNRALRFSLAVELAPEYGREAPASVLEQAVGAKAFLKENNTKNKAILMSPGLIGGSSRFNIYRGDY